MITSNFPLALSIRQPWAWLIVNGYKDIENRSWRTPFRGRVLIHAGKLHDGSPLKWDWPKIPRPDSFQYGGIIGEATITGCVTESDSPWFYGEFGFTLTNAKPLPFTPYRGRLGFFEVEKML